MSASRCCFSSLFCLSSPSFSLSPPKRKEKITLHLYCRFSTARALPLFRESMSPRPFPRKIHLNSILDGKLSLSGYSAVHHSHTYAHPVRRLFLNSLPPKKVPLGNLEIGRSKSEEDEKERELKKRRMNLKRHKNNFKSGRCRTKTQVVKETTSERVCVCVCVSVCVIVWFLVMELLPD